MKKLKIKQIETTKKYIKESKRLNMRDSQKRLMLFCAWRMIL